MTNEQLSNISIDKPDFSNGIYNSLTKKGYNQNLDNTIAVMLQKSKERKIRRAEVIIYEKSRAELLTR